MKVTQIYCGLDGKIGINMVRLNVVKMQRIVQKHFLESLAPWEHNGLMFEEVTQ